MALYLYLLLQLAHQTTSALEALVMAAISVGLLVVLAMSGKVHMGFTVPGFPSPLLRSRKRILSKYFDYYIHLSHDNKKRFEQRVQEFIRRKQFVPRQIDQITEEMKVLIAACAVQVTFGFPNVFLSHFKRILVYPNDYYSTINQVYHKGEVNPKLGAIVLSWQHFVSGYLNNQDGINLGLHEMTHALQLENRIVNQEFDFIDQDALDKWGILSNNEMRKMENDTNHFFRSYAKTNAHEFMAIAVENFFERSAEFKASMPEMYETLSLILKQDPMNN